MEAKVMEVTESGTLRLADGREVRLASMAGPNVLDGDSEAAAQTVALLRQLAEGKTVRVFTDAKDRDRYGRIVARAVLIGEGAWLEPMLIEQGVMRVAISGNAACIAALLAVERKARDEKRGLWAREKFRVFDAADHAALNREIGRFVVVEGTIRRVGDTRARLYLDFGRRYTEDFSIIVPAAFRSELAKIGGDPKNWRGRRVRVRGILVAWGGPAIEVNAAQAVEMLESAER